MNNQTKRNFNIFRANNTFNSSPKNIDYEFEYDKNKEIIIKLKEQIIAKDKEILDLKTSKNKKEEEYGKAIYLFQEIVNSSNKNEENSKKKNKKNPSKNNNKNDNGIKYNNENNDKINTPRNHSKQLSKNKVNESLKIKIIKTNNIINKKEQELEELKSKSKVTTFSKYQDNYNKDYKELKSIEKQNDIISNINYDIEKKCYLLEENNKELINKLEKFKEEFKIYQEYQGKKIKKLEDEIEKQEEREENCRLFHVNKGNINDNEDLENEIKKMEKTINKLQKEKKMKDEEIQKITNKIKDLNNKNDILNKQIKEFVLNKQNGEKDLERKTLIEKVDNQNKINNYNYQIEEEKKIREKLKEQINNLDNENIKLKKDISDLESKYLELIKENKELEKKQLVNEINKNEEPFFTTDLKLINKKNSEDNNKINEENNIVNEYEIIKSNNDSIKSNDSNKNNLFEKNKSNIKNVSYSINESINNDISIKKNKSISQNNKEEDDNKLDENYDDQEFEIINDIEEKEDNNINNQNEVINNKKTEEIEENILSNYNNLNKDNNIYDENQFNKFRESSEEIEEDFQF